MDIAIFIIAHYILVTFLQNGVLMANVVVKINGRDYQLACDDGQEEQLRFLADEVDDRIRALIYAMGSNPGEAMALVLAALTMADEAHENKKEIVQISGELKQVTRALHMQKEQSQENRIEEMEAAMAVTLEEIAERIEKIAQQIEIQ